MLYFVLMADSFFMRMQVEAQRMLARTMSYGITNYRYPAGRRNSFSTALDITGRIPTRTTPLEVLELLQFAQACQKLPGDMAEAGVYRGSTAAVMLSVTDKRLHLFDTFEGLPESEGSFKRGEYAGSLAEVQANLSQWKERTEYHPGMFPASASGLENLRFSFVHLDLDLYQSTLDSLGWFWPRMNVGGVILSHDYPSSDGVARAFQEFLDPLNVPCFPLAGQNCVVVKT